MTDAEKVVKALRVRAVVPREAPRPAMSEAELHALADFVEATEELLHWTTYAYPAPEDEMRAQSAALARLAEVLHAK